jgi:predicted amidophosphoribosyltransferase
MKIVYQILGSKILYTSHMPLWRLFFTTILDALFPLSPAEEAVAALTPEKALDVLPRAPEFGSHTVPLSGVRAIFAYKDERVSKMVWNVKYKKSAHAVRLGGYALWRNLTDGANISAQPASTSPVILVPMPITLRRRRERGYNQCELLADEIMRLERANSYTKDVGTVRFILENNLLVRTIHKSRQTLKDRSDRLAGAKGIFAVNEKAGTKIRGNFSEPNNIQIVVIDDVITTGSTIKEAVDTLRAAGFENVRGLSLAH